MVCSKCGSSLSPEAQFCVQCGQKLQVSERNGAGPLLRRAKLFLEEKEWGKADDYCERVLDLEPENAQAYLVKLMIRAQVVREEDLATAKVSFSEWKSFKDACHYADDDLRTRLENYLRSTQEALRLAEEEKHRQEKIQRQREELELQEKQAWQREVRYNNACRYGGPNASRNDLKEALKLFAPLTGYKDVSERVRFCKERLEKLEKEEHLKQYEFEQQMRRASRNKRIVGLLIGLVLVVVLVFVIKGVNASHNERAKQIASNLVGVSFSGEYNQFGSYVPDGACYETWTLYEYTYSFQRNGTVLINTVTSYDRAPYITRDGQIQWDSVEHTSKVADHCEVIISFFGDITLNIDGESFELKVNDEDMPVSMEKNNITYS